MTLLWIPVCIAIFLTGLSVMLLAIDSFDRNRDVWPCDTGDCYADAHGGCDRPCPISTPTKEKENQ